PAHGIGQRIAGAFGAYRTPSTEVMAEWLQLSYRQENGGRYQSRGGYVQASRAFGKLRPYYRYDRLDIPANTPFIGSFGSSEFNIFRVRLAPAGWGGLETPYGPRDARG